MYWLNITEEQREDIEWICSQGLLNETSKTTFSPFKSVTRSQAVTALWLYFGKPEPKKNENPFTDIEKSDPYYKAVSWAYENELLPEWIAIATVPLFQPNAPAHDSTIIDALKRMLNNDLESIADGKLDFKQLAGGCTRVNFSHYLHFAHKCISPNTLTNSDTPAESGVPTKFVDVMSGDYFADSVLWAVEKNITSGTSKTTFSPNSTCTNAQILAFLYRANGSPEPTISNPFADIKTTDYFYKAALWAAEKGMVSGSTFGASTPCTRAATVEYIWKAAGSPAASYDGKFDDVPASADYAQAVAWALENGVTSGTSKTTFGPTSTCTRGQIVTFLYRAFGK